MIVLNVDETTLLVRPQSRKRKGKKAKIILTHNHDNFVKEKKYVYTIYKKLHILIDTQSKTQKSFFWNLPKKTEFPYIYINFFLSIIVIDMTHAWLLWSFSFHFDVWRFSKLWVLGIVCLGNIEKKTSSRSKRPCFDKRHTIVVITIYMCLVCEEGFYWGGTLSYVSHQNKTPSFVFLEQ